MVNSNQTTSQPNPKNKWTKKSANLGADVALYGTAWQTEEENPHLHNTYCQVDKGLSADMADPWAHGLLKYP